MRRRARLRRTSAEHPGTSRVSSFSPLERLLLPLVRRFVALWVRPSVMPDDLGERFVPGRAVVYALEKQSLVDLAVLEYVCRERRWPLPLKPVTGPSRPASPTSPPCA